MKLGIYRISEKTQVPCCATDFSACFDLKACFHKNKVKCCSGVSNEKVDLEVSDDYIILPPRSRALIPTGIIFVIPEGYQMKILPRSGLAWKNGVTVINSPGTIDEDYTEETFVLLHNTSYEPFKICNGDRIAQGELVKNTSRNIMFYDAFFNDVNKIKLKTNRNGGMGSTGV